MPITTNVNLNPAHDEVYSIQLYVIKFVNNLWQVCDITRHSTRVSSTNKTDCHDITEILLKVAVNTITLTLAILIESETGVDPGFQVREGQTL